MRKALGYSIIHDPRFAAPIEADTFTCHRCNQVVDRVPFKSITDEITVNGRSRPIGGWCHSHDAPLCLNCARYLNRTGQRCQHIEQWCEQVERRAHYDELLGRK